MKKTENGYEFDPWKTMELLRAARDGYTLRKANMQGDAQLNPDMCDVEIDMCEHLIRQISHDIRESGREFIDSLHS